MFIVMPNEETINMDYIEKIRKEDEKGDYSICLNNNDFYFFKNEKDRDTFYKELLIKMDNAGLLLK